MFKLSARARGLRQDALRTVLPTEKKMLARNAQMHFTPEFLRLPQAERIKQLRNLAIYTEIARERSAIVQKFLLGKINAARRLSGTDERMVFSELEKIERTTVKALAKTQKIFKISPHESLTTLTEPYPLNSLHKLVKKEKGILENIKYYIEKLREDGKISPHFKPPWEA